MFLKIALLIIPLSLIFWFQNCGSENKATEAASKTLQSLSECQANQHLENGECVFSSQECSVQNGSGSQAWELDGYGPCTVQSCNASYKISGNGCVPDDTPVTCNKDFHLEDGACKANKVACAVNNGAGFKNWNGRTYEPCVASACNAGFSIRKAKCTSTPARQGETLPPSESGKTYYVSPSGDDSKDGLTVKTALKTPQKASSKTMPGDVVLFMEGTYENKSDAEANILNIARSGTAEAWITYRAFPGHNVKFKANSKMAIFVWGASYIIVDGIELEGNRAKITQKIAEKYVNNPDHPLMANRGLLVGYNVPQKAMSHHIWIQNLEVHDFSGGGINANWSDYITIQDNEVYRTSFWASNNESGISIFQPSDFDKDNSVYRINIRRNRSYDNECRIPFFRINPRRITDGHGIIIDDSMHNQKANFPDHPSAAYTGKILVANNLVYRNGASGIYTYKSEKVDFYHNISYANVKTKSMPLSESEAYAHASKNIRFLYNIIVPIKGRTTNTKAKDVASSGVSFDYNIYYGGRAPGIKGKNDIIADPKFTDAAKGNFKVSTSSPAIDKVPTKVVTHDFALVARPKGKRADIGAYEVK